MIHAFRSLALRTRAAIVLLVLAAMLWRVAAPEEALAHDHGPAAAAETGQPAKGAPGPADPHAGHECPLCHLTASGVTPAPVLVPAPKARVLRLDRAAPAYAPPPVLQARYRPPLRAPPVA